MSWISLAQVDRGNSKLVTISMVIDLLHGIVLFPNVRDNINHDEFKKENCFQLYSILQTFHNIFVPRIVPTISHLILFHIYQLFLSHLFPRRDVVVQKKTLRTPHCRVDWMSVGLPKELWWVAMRWFYILMVPILVDFCGKWIHDIHGFYGVRLVSWNQYIT